MSSQVLVPFPAAGVLQLTLSSDVGTFLLLIEMRQNTSWDKYLNRVKASFQSVPLQEYFEFHATFRPSDFKIKLERNAFKVGFYHAKIFTHLPY